MISCYHLYKCYNAIDQCAYDILTYSAGEGSFRLAIYYRDRWQQVSNLIFFRKDKTVLYGSPGGTFITYDLFLITYLFLLISYF